jgi:hypothetical protein
VYSTSSRQEAASSKGSTAGAVWRKRASRSTSPQKNERFHEEHQEGDKKERQAHDSVLNRCSFGLLLDRPIYFAKVQVLGVSG